jgi:ectoine hydroxylase-related dioxygenase (phytanoyl-CoA dioxygenase family)
MKSATTRPGPKPPRPTEGVATTREILDRPPTERFLTSNGQPVPYDDRYFGTLRSSQDVADDPDAMRRRFRSDGYLLMPGLLDGAEVLALRAAYFATPTTIDPSQRTHRPAASVVAAPTHGMRGSRAHTFVRTQLFQAFTDQPVLRQTAQILLRTEAQTLPRRILREYRAATSRATRAHTDLAYIKHPSSHVVTAWIPIGDCTIDMGGLIYLEGSHKIARSRLDALRSVTDRPTDHRPLTHDLEWVVRALDRRWLAADFEAGDVIFHSADIVHASLDAASTTPRLSTDVRFIPRSETPDPRWGSPWSADDTF